MTEVTRQSQVLSDPQLSTWTINPRPIMMNNQRQSQQQQQQRQLTTYDASILTTPTQMTNATQSQEIRNNPQKKFIETLVNLDSNNNNNNIVIMNSDGVVQMPDGRVFHFYYFGFDEESNTESVVFRGNLDVWPVISCNDLTQTDSYLRYPEHCIPSKILTKIIRYYSLTTFIF